MSHSSSFHGTTTPTVRVGTKLARNSRRRRCNRRNANTMMTTSPSSFSCNKNKNNDKNDNQNERSTSSLSSSCSGRRPLNGRNEKRSIIPRAIEDAQSIPAGVDGDWSHVTPDFLWESELERRTEYLQDFERVQVRTALDIAFHAHDGQKRKSGEPYIIHPVAVTCILASYYMDHETLCAGLLHDTVEDTEFVTFESVESMFGPSVRAIVEGETKVSKVSSTVSKAADDSFVSSTFDEPDVKADDLQQMFLAMTGEIRVIIVKLADRLHNMRTLGSMKPEKRIKISNETLLVFAPLAKLLGMYDMKNELEEIAFGWASPGCYEAVAQRKEELERVHLPVINNVAAKLNEALKDDDFLRGSVISFAVDKHVKENYGIYRKALKSKKKPGFIHDKEEDSPAKEEEEDNVDEEEEQKLRDLKSRLPNVNEIAQIRIVLLDDMSTKGLSEAAKRSHAIRVTYHVLGLVHTLYPPVPGSMKDYIATPKLNAYRALHTTVLPIERGDMNDTDFQSANESFMEDEQNEEVFPLEIQIRTEQMHLGAIWGICADRELKTGWRKRAIVDIFKRRNEMRQELLERGIPLTADEKSFMEEEEEDNKFLQNLSQSTAGNVMDNEERNVAPMRQVLWLKMIQAWQEEFLGVLSAREFVDTVTGDLLGRRTFVFSRAGQVINLPYGATVVDYASYRDCLSEMVEVKVNGQAVDFGKKLNNAEVVEIVRSTDSAETMKQKVARFRMFLPAAVTKAARYKIEKFLDEHDSTFRERKSENTWEMESYDLIGLPSGKIRADRKAVSMFVTSYLRLECSDRSGLLADISSVIANQGMSIVSYNGNKSPTVSESKFDMNFEVTFNESELYRGEALGNLDARLAKVCTDLMTRVDGVDNCSAFCALPDDNMFSFQK